jgi:hypothetical protein
MNLPPANKEISLATEDILKKKDKKESFPTFIVDIKHCWEVCL